ncbi:hypothetical protein EGI22_01230 [Lacihabitans sp. LS3-19]|nr:hypothetical protein [Lacihabitans sp. LS3-19]
MKNILFLAFFSIILSVYGQGIPVFGQSPSLVYEGNYFGNYTDIDRIVKLNTSGTDIILFPSNDEFNGRELWKYDEATGNSTRITDINTNLNASSIGELTFFNNLAFFVNYTPQGAKLWSSDGTPVGTSVYFDIYPGTQAIQPKELTVVGNQMFFSARNGIELWKTDGNYPTGNTVFVKSIYNDSDIGSISKLFKAGTKLFFVSQTYSLNEFTLWSSDGTTLGTIPLKNFGSYFPALFYEHNGNLFFLGNDGISGFELWKSDGTVAGTQMVVDLQPGSQSSHPIFYTTLNGLLYFSSNSSIYKTDGTAAGTVLALNHSGSKLKALNGSLYFVKSASGKGEEIYKSDGTNAGTVLLKSYEYFDNGNGLNSQISFFENGTSDVFFNIRTREFGDEIWKSGGTAATTTLLKDIRTGIFDSSPSNYIKSGNKVYFTATNGQNGFGLYKSDGTTTGTVRLSSFIGINNGTSPDQIGILNNSVYYNGYSGFNESFFRINTAVNPGNSWNLKIKNVSDYLAFNGKIYFGGESSWGKELYVDNETYYQPYNVKDIYAGTTGSVQNSSNPAHLTALNSTHFMFAAEDTDGIELWKSDGTSAGTVKVKDINPSGDSFPSSLVSFNSNMYFWANTPSEGVELWKSDGTAANTTIVQNFNGFNSSADPNSKIINNGSKLIFGMYTNYNTGYELYSSDGNTISLVKDIAGGINSSSPSDFIKGSGSNIFFTATTKTSGRELWITDGTNANTHLVKNIHPTGSSSPNQLIFLNGILYFTADDGTNGFELWRSDGTEVGTYMVKDIHYGIYSSTPSDFCIVNNALYFSAEDAHHGRELWKTDGTESGTVLAYNVADDFVTEINSSNPFNLFFVNGTLYFSADNKINGREFFHYKPCELTDVSFSQFSRLRSSSQSSLGSIDAANSIQYGRTNHFQASSSITLSPGFMIKASDSYSSVNNVFTAEIRTCY